MRGEFRWRQTSPGCLEYSRGLSEGLKLVLHSETQVDVVLSLPGVAYRMYGRHTSLESAVALLGKLLVVPAVPVPRLAKVRGAWLYSYAALATTSEVRRGFRLVEELA